VLLKQLLMHMDLCNDIDFAKLNDSTKVVCTTQCCYQSSVCLKAFATAAAVYVRLSGQGALSTWMQAISPLMALQRRCRAVGCKIAYCF